jgi:CoA:oxalate CoA-transferase
MGSNSRHHALDDLRVLDLTRAAAGPACTRMLAEMGAQVIKVEPTPGGDMIRHMSALTFRNERSLYFVQQNRGKKSLCVNLKDPRGLALVAELVPHVDVVVENFRPGVMDALGLGYERLCELRPDIILCSISALGQTGPLAHIPGYDFIAQAYSGITSMTGPRDEAPYMPAAAVGDISTGVHGALAVLAALHHRNRTGRGEHLDVALLDAYYHYHDANVAAYSGSEGAFEPTRSGRHVDYLCPCGIYRGSGGSIVVMSFLHHWPDLCRAMGREEWIEDPAWSTDAARLANREQVVGEIEAWLQSFPDITSATKHLEEFGVPCAPVLSVAETVNHPHHRQRGTVRRVEDRLHGEVDLPGFPIKFKHLPNNIPLDAPTLGEHNTEILTELLGRSERDVEKLRLEGVLLEKEC